MLEPTSKFAHVYVDTVGQLPPSKDTAISSPSLIVFRAGPRLFLFQISQYSLIDELVLHFVGCYGAPETYTADRGRQFTSTLWHDLTFLGCKIIHTTLYNPNANGVFERFHSVLKASLKAHNHPFDWLFNLGWVILGIFSMVN